MEKLIAVILIFLFLMGLNFVILFLTVKLGLWAIAGLFGLNLMDKFWYVLALLWVVSSLFVRVKVN